MRTALLLCAALFAMPLRAEVPAVVTDIPAVQSLAAQVMGDLGTAAVLLAPGANAHSYQMRPSEARAVQEAALVVWVGPELTPWLDRAMAGTKGVSLLLLEAEGTRLRTFGEAGAEAEEHDHEHEDMDPHAWLDPDNAAAWLAAIAAELGRLDPDNAAVYAANAEAAQQRIAAMDAAIAATLAPVAGRPFVVSHDAYGYFADRYGLALAGAVAAGDAASPGAARLAELRSELEAGGVVCIFPEAQHDPKPVEVLAEATGARIGAPLDPAGSGLAPGPGLYEALMEGLAEAIAECLSGR